MKVSCILVLDEAACIHCVLCEKGCPVLTIAEKLDELVPMQGSRDFNSDTNTVCPQDRMMLEQGWMEYG